MNYSRYCCSYEIKYMVSPSSAASMKRYTATTAGM